MDTREVVWKVGGEGRTGAPFMYAPHYHSRQEAEDLKEVARKRAESMGEGITWYVTQCVLRTTTDGDGKVTETLCY